MNSSNISDEYYCNDRNQLKEVTLLMVILAIIAAVLLPGNIIILLVSLKSAYSPNRIYIAALAVVDIAICLQYGIATLASALMDTYPDPSQPEEFLLSAWVEIATVITLTLLVVIALDRYAAVCHPGRPKLTKGDKNRASSYCFQCTVCISLQSPNSYNAVGYSRNAFLPPVGIIYFHYPNLLWAAQLGSVQEASDEEEIMYCTHGHICEA